MAGGQSDDKPDLWEAMGYLAGYCSELPDMTPDDYQEAAELALMTDGRAVPPSAFRPVGLTPLEDAGIPIIQTVRVAPPAHPGGLGAIIAAALSAPVEYDGWWDVLSHAARLISDRYDLDHEAVLDALFKYDIDGIASNEGPVSLEALLERPVGWAAVGLVVAQEVGGLDLDTLPPGAASLIHYH